MNKHLKRGLVYGLIITVLLPIQFIIAEHTNNQLLQSICNILWYLAAPVFFIWDACGAHGCQGMALIPFIILTCLIYIFCVITGLVALISFIIERKRANR